ncbi:peptide chain release factor-like protein [Halalkaliarchaeum desulfuricum]|uniref:Peptide chain release factor-like protein n=1 Tax=Halalkaliarchaeum desulfuricum TaxID=2055893 RepID=A0A343THE5_9EURY|nr:Vms1/Ankzf1 family peptidyl-tRNA hydrolase [Halalkaliarchaeum desulfuricum]AUX08517.1 peptide chain release factor-like protein [Halalkaliarchaeum desulfuricum]
MIDRLLGRAELKARIDELEEANEHLERQLEAESDRRADAVTERQRAEERINRLEDRIEELQDRVSRAEEGRDEELSFRHAERCRGRRLESVLDRLRSLEAPREGALTAYVETEVPDSVREVLGDRSPLVRDAAPALVLADDAGVVAAALAPPLPPEPFSEWEDCFRLPDKWFRPTGRFGFGLVRSDTFAFGVYDGDELDAFEGFESDVISDHSKGGFSQGRFERRRDEQIDAHVDRVRNVLKTRDEDLDRTVLVGERTVLSRLESDVDVTATAGAGGTDRDALAAAFEEFWTTKLYGL